MWATAATIPSRRKCGAAGRKPPALDAPRPPSPAGCVRAARHGNQPHSLGIYEKIGEQVLRLRLTPRQRFRAASAIVGFVLGAADMGQELPEALLSGQVRAEHYLAGVVQSWRSLDPA